MRRRSFVQLTIPAVASALMVISTVVPAARRNGSPIARICPVRDRWAGAPGSPDGSGTRA